MQTKYTSMQEFLNDILALEARLMEKENILIKNKRYKNQKEGETQKQNVDKKKNFPSIFSILNLDLRNEYNLTNGLKRQLPLPNNIQAYYNFLCCYYKNLMGETNNKNEVNIEKNKRGNEDYIKTWKEIEVEVFNQLNNQLHDYYFQEGLKKEDLEKVVRKELIKNEIMLLDDAISSLEKIMLSYRLVLNTSIKLKYDKKLIKKLGRYSTYESTHSEVNNLVKNTNGEMKLLTLIKELIMRSFKMTVYTGIPVKPGDLKKPALAFGLWKFDDTRYVNLYDSAISIFMNMTYGKEKISPTSSIFDQ